MIVSAIVGALVVLSGGYAWRHSLKADVAAAEAKVGTVESAVKAKISQTVSSAVADAKSDLAKAGSVPADVLAKVETAIKAAL